MYFVVLGAGEVGLRLSQILSNAGHEIVLIEKEKSRVSHIYNKIDCKLIIDEGARTEVFYEAEITRADYYIAATNIDETNLITCLRAKQIAPEIKTIARLRNQEYINTSDQALTYVDHIVHPEHEAALSIIRSIEIGGGASDAFTFQNFGNVLVRNYFIDSDSKILGVQLKNINNSLNIPHEFISKFLIILINRRNEAIIPSGEFEFQEGDEVFFLGNQTILDGLFQFLGKKVQAAKNIKNIIVLGASALSEQIVDCYHNTSNKKIFSILGKKRFASRDITVIDEDLHKCEDFADKYPEVTVLHANVTEEDVMEDLEIGQVDMLIANTQSQERNIVLAAHSHNLGVSHTIAIVGNPVYFNIAAELDISMSLSVRSAVVSSIVGIVRGRNSLYSLAEGSFGLIECKVSEKSTAIYKAINTVVLPQNSLILCVSNEKQEGNIIHGNTILQPSDKILCIAHPDSIEKLHMLFSPSESSSNKK